MKFLEKDQDWKNEQTLYWFEVEGVKWAIRDQNGWLSLIDEGYPVDACNDHDGLFDKLSPLIEEHIDA